MGRVDPAKLLGLGSSRRTGSGYSRPVEVRTGIVTRCDASGVWVTEHDGDARAPLGPCRGATTAVLLANGSGYVLRRVPLAKGTEVLFASTSHGVWIVTADLREG